MTEAVLDTGDRITVVEEEVIHHAERRAIGLTALPPGTTKEPQHDGNGRGDVCGQGQIKIEGARRRARKLQVRPYGGVVHQCLPCSGPKRAYPTARLAPQCVLFAAQRSPSRAAARTRPFGFSQNRTRAAVTSTALVRQAVCDTSPHGA